MGRPCYRAYKDRESPCDECPVIATFEDGQMHSSEEIVQSRSGELYHVLVRTAPLRGANGEIEEVMEMSTNITEIRNMQSQLESLGMMVSSVSHGVKGLLTGVDGGLYVANSGLRHENTEQIREGLEIVQRNSRRIRRIIMDVLFYSKERELSFEKTSALELAVDVSSHVDIRADELAIVFQHDFDVKAGWFNVDPQNLRTALVNLLENAFDACRLDSERTKHTVSFSVRREEEEAVIFEIADNGVGIAEETRARIFDLFFSSKGCEGTGIGLYVCHDIVKRHGGTIEVDSQFHKGTRFTVRIPTSP